MILTAKVAFDYLCLHLLTTAAPPSPRTSSFSYFLWNSSDIIYSSFCWVSSVILCTYPGLCSSSLGLLRLICILSFICAFFFNVLNLLSLSSLANSFLGVVNTTYLYEILNYYCISILSSSLMSWLFEKLPPLSPPLCSEWSLSLLSESSSKIWVNFIFFLRLNMASEKLWLFLVGEIYGDRPPARLFGDFS